MAFEFLGRAMFWRRSVQGGPSRTAALVVLLAVSACTRSAVDDAGADADAAGDAAIADASGADADTDSASPECSPGEFHVEPCGTCGTRLVLCSGGAWSPRECEEIGVCTPGDVDVRVGWIPAQSCGRDQRVCTPQCTWGAWTTVNPGYPASGGLQYGRDSGYKADTCTDKTALSYDTDPNTCMQTTGPSEGGNGPHCNRGCPGTPRTTSEAELEICVVSGLHQWGPQAVARTIKMGAFYIDKHLVSYNRYQSCVTAGACTALSPKTYEGFRLVDDPALAAASLPSGSDFVIVTATLEQARAFCASDGGRELPSGIQWERALRETQINGEWEWPRRNLTSSRPCSTNFPGCSASNDNPTFAEGRLWRAIRGHPDVVPRSWVWGVTDFFHFYEYTRSWYPESYVPYPIDTESVSPEYPPFGRRIQMRGMSEQEPYGDENSGFSRMTPDLGFGAFRCSRWAQ